MTVHTSGRYNDTHAELDQEVDLTLKITVGAHLTLENSHNLSETQFIPLKTKWNV